MISTPPAQSPEACRSRRTGLFAFGMIGLLFAAPSATAQENTLADEAGPLPSIEIAPGDSQSFRAAVLQFREVGPPVGDGRIKQLREEIERGLTFSSVVQPLDHVAFLASEQSSALSDTAFDCDSWKQSGADAVLFGEVKRDGLRLRADIRVVDVGTCRSVRTGNVAGQRDAIGRMGRTIADETVEALTGLRGVAASEITFVSDRTGDRQVYAMSADGRNPRAATSSGSLKMFPEWTPDGRAILYTHYDRGQPGFSLTSRAKDITPGPILDSLLRGLPKYRGRFDPTGEELALVSSVDGAAEIFRVRRQGNDPRRLTNHSAIDVSPSWSPDGQEIVFCSDRSGSPQLYLMDRNGGNLRRLTYTGSYNSSPVWSPDGRWIAYETRVRGQFDIWLIDPTGQINFPIVENPRSDETPTWSPDSRKIAFSSSRRGRYDIYVMDWNGENLLRLTARQGKNIQPDWGPRLR